MARYKLIQDIEAEDHILGPLSLRQFIFALIAVFLFYCCYFVTSKGLALMLIIFLPPALFTGFFAIPFGRDQPTEVWALAKLNFLFKPKKRIWNQSGIKELVTINVPRKIERVLTDGLTQQEVIGRLNALASTLDTRGWAVKHVEAANSPYERAGSQQDSDRLLSVVGDISTSEYDLKPDEDLLDIENNPLSHQFEDRIQESAKERRTEVIKKMNSQKAPTPIVESSPANDNWFQDNATGLGAANSESEIKIQKNTEMSHMRTLVREKDQKTDKPQSELPQTAMTTPQDPAILNLAKSNDLNVSTLAREAFKAKNGVLPNDEVVVSLH